MRILKTAAIVGAVPLLALTACANPDDVSTAGNVQEQEVGDEIPIEVDEDVAAMVPQEYRDRGSWTASINPDVAPIKFINGEGEIAGLVPDLLYGAAEVMDLDLDLEEGAFDAMIPGLEAERHDVIASIGDFQERQETVDFIDYLQTATAILVPADFEQDEITPADLCGMSVGFSRGTAQQGLLEEAAADCEERGEETVTLVGYQDGAAGTIAVSSGQEDAFWGDGPVMAYNAAQEPETFKVVYAEDIGPYGIGVLKSNPELRDALREALLHLVETGAYDQILARWGQEEWAMPDLPLNTGPKLED